MGVKRIADAVHGTITLNPVEAEIISTKAFQRLRGVKHLGLASLAFPGADYSRFSHGIGTMHVTKLILDNLVANIPTPPTDEELRLYRMAALLHDIGHYPFSHTFERALKNYYSSTQVFQLVGSDTPPSKPERIWLHEEMGEKVIKNDPQLVAILDRNGYDKDLLCRIIQRVEPPRFANLVSSDLDADRTDYLMRTAKHTGLPYGNVDLPYLLSQIRVDNEARICFSVKGMRAAEHLLLCRYFDYQQVSYHKTVAGLELVLNDAIGVLLRDSKLSCSSSDLQAMIEGEGWYSFDDGHVTSLMRDHLRSGQLDEHDKLLFESILNRMPPKMITEREKLGSPSGTLEMFRHLEKIALEKIPEWKEKYGTGFWIWTQRGTSLTKIGSSVPVSELATAEDSYDKIEQAVRIQTGNGSSTTIQEYDRSLMSVLSGYGLYSIRIYALLDSAREHLRPEITAAVNADLGELWLQG